MDNSHIIQIIEVRLKEMRKTKKEFYKETGISSATYSQWNTGLFAPSRRKLEVVSNYIGVPISDLTGATEQKEKPPTESGELSEKDIRLIEWFRSLPPEKQRAILIAQDGPTDAADS